MNNAFRRFLSISLVLCILAVGGLAHAQSAEHAGHHAQHQTATHGTLLCSWMCAAEAGLDTAVVLIQIERGSETIGSFSQSPDVFPLLSRTSSGRAPPSFSL